MLLSTDFFFFPSAAGWKNRTYVSSASLGAGAATGAALKARSMRFSHGQVQGRNKSALTHQTVAAAEAVTAGMWGPYLRRGLPFRDPLCVCLEIPVSGLPHYVNSGVTALHE